MVRRKIRGAPFGVKSERFRTLGLHPGFGFEAGTRKLSKVSPGSYDTSVPEKPINFLTGWSRKLEVEEFSRNLGYCTPILNERLRSKGFNGPGWHELFPETKMVKVTIPTERRFVEKKSVATPGPGFYDLRKNTFRPVVSTIPTFERDNFQKRSVDESKSYHLPPNLYKVSGSIDSLLSKLVSKRGPYDLFTGSRDETSGYGYFRKPAKTTGDIFFALPGGTEVLKLPHNAFKGKFLRCGRDSVCTMRHVVTDLSSCKREPKDPGPGSYDPRSPRKPEPKVQHPFRSSLLYSRPQIKIGLKPGPGRYRIDQKTCIKGGGSKSVFLSKTKRGGPLRDKMSWFE